MIPLPSLRIDRLADRPQNFKAGSRILGDVMVAFSHERADRGGGRIKVRDAVLVHNVPEATHWEGVRNEEQKRGVRGDW
jgi:hypothetical protein